MEQTCEEKVRKYLRAVKQVLSELVGVTGNAAEIVDLASRYASDAEWYLSRNDCLTALACISYAEGLLDALRLEGRVSFSWPSQVRRTKVLVGGVFDILHPGHVEFLAEAASLGEVYVVVARDETVKQSKGRYPVLSEEERLKLVRSLKPVHEAFLGEYPPNYHQVLLRVKPDIILLGYDQAWLKEVIESAAARLGLKTSVKIGSKLEGYSSTLLKEKIIKGILSNT
ncbi:MAG: DUF357 domain-containing protein [Thermofilum sp.]